MIHHSVSLQELLSSARQLSLREQLLLVEQILGDLARQLPTEPTTVKPLRSLYGLWQGFSVTDEDITQIRREMWGQFAERDL